jgi:GTPase SAR1 family protein
MLRIVITGAPGAGKTTLLQALQARGYTIVGDTARTIDPFPQLVEARHFPKVFVLQPWKLRPKNARGRATGAGSVPSMKRVLN